MKNQEQSPNIKMAFQDISLIQGYHAHVYFDESTFEQAKALCEEAGQRFSVTVVGFTVSPLDPIRVGVVSLPLIIVSMPIYYLGWLSIERV